MENFIHTIIREMNSIGSTTAGMLKKCDVIDLEPRGFFFPKFKSQLK